MKQERIVQRKKGDKSKQEHENIKIGWNKHTQTACLHMYKIALI